MHNLCGVFKFSDRGFSALPDVAVSSSHPTRGVLEQDPCVQKRLVASWHDMLKE